MAEGVTAGRVVKAVGLRLGADHLAGVSTVFIIVAGISFVCAFARPLGMSQRLSTD